MTLTTSIFLKKNAHFGYFYSLFSISFLSQNNPNQRQLEMLVSKKEDSSRERDKDRGDNTGRELSETISFKAMNPCLLLLPLGAN